MTGRVLLMLCGTLAVPLAVADERPQPPTAACLRLDNRVLGPRSSDRPLPLLSGDAAHGFHPACTVSWRMLSPRNEPLPVTDCFRGSLLQIANDSACGSGTGLLWVSSRWVMTSAELSKPAVHAAACQQLDTGAWAGTRAFDFDCVPQTKALEPGQPPPPSRAAASAHAVKSVPVQAAGVNAVGAQATASGHAQPSAPSPLPHPSSAPGTPPETVAAGAEH